MERNIKDGRGGRRVAGVSNERLRRFTVRLDAEQESLFESIAKELGLPSASAAIKRQALRGNDAGALVELRAQMSGLSNALAGVEQRRREDRAAFDAMDARFDEICALQTEALEAFKSLAEAVAALAERL